jgi:coniferyl-aldehyde dehydrogenase
MPHFEASPALPTELSALLEAQRRAFLAEGAPSAATRIDRLDRCIALLEESEAALCEALDADFGQRPAAITRFADLLPSREALKHARANVRRWMRPERRKPDLPYRLVRVRTEIRYQPLGVVGLISPWNFPVNLTFTPLAGVLAAGNRCMVKPSEVTSRTAALLDRLVASRFDPSELAVIQGDAQVAQAFSGLPFDHLIFTGSTQVGRHVMGAAAKHLVPVTLELGGKCPTVIGRSAKLEAAADRILLGKLANAGQICLAPDYVYVPRESIEGFVQAARASVARMYPSLPANRDYTSIVSERHVERLGELAADAQKHGARLVPLRAEESAREAAPRLLAPALLLDVNDAMAVMREEIFGPLLPVLPYDAIGEVIEGINRRPRPLALYYFGDDEREERALLERTTSGGVTLNDVMMHVMVEDLPFGGVGASGMGAYHGVHGFRRFSHARAVYRQSPLDLAGLLGLRPPYGPKIERTLRFLLRR